MSRAVNASTRTDVASRLRRVLSSVELDCQCQTKLEEALERFSILESRHQLRRGLRDAQHRRDWIAAQLAFLADIDEITDREGDPTVFTEMALMFDEIANQAAEASRALRNTAALSAESVSKKPS